MIRISEGKLYMSHIYLPICSIGGNIIRITHLRCKPVFSISVCLIKCKKYIGSTFKLFNLHSKQIFVNTSRTRLPLSNCSSGYEAHNQQFVVRTTSHSNKYLHPWNQRDNSMAGLPVYDKAMTVVRHLLRGFESGSGYSHFSTCCLWT
jgi:hypothetical protein